MSNNIPSYGEQIDVWVASVFADWEQSDEYEYMDNYRVARVDDGDAQRRYEEARDSGCCGSHDVDLTGPDGHVYSLGFNYGH